MGGALGILTVTPSCKVVTVTISAHKVSVPSVTSSCKAAELAQKFYANVR